MSSFVIGLALSQKGDLSLGNSSYPSYRFFEILQKDPIPKKYKINSNNFNLLLLEPKLIEHGNLQLIIRKHVDAK